MTGQGPWRTINVQLTLSDAAFLRGAGRASAATKQLGRDLEATGAVSVREQSRLRQFAAAGGRALAALALAATVTMVGLTTSIVRTGVAYNQLEQTARAAFTTVLGGAEEANEMMDEIAEFARSSPFPRQVFIEGARQLVAFGMEAGKVVEVMESVQDAVAAAGGDAQMISEVINVLAKIQSTGTITADNLNSLGIRGVDAAKIIGDQFGKTAKQIRSEIALGAIDADTAISALVAGMQSKFGGAAANVKNTWVGATDRIKGAWRDISSALVEPFIHKRGGGPALDWANAFADALRSIEKTAVPDVAERLASAATRGAPVVERIMGAVAAIDDSSVQSLVEGLGSVAPLSAAASGGLVAMAAGSIPFLGQMPGVLNPIPAALIALVAASPEARKAVREVAGDLWPLIRALADQLAPVIVEISTALERVLPSAIRTTGAAMVAATSIAAELLDIVGPLGVGLLNLGGRGVASALDLVSAAMEKVGQGLQENHTIITALTAALMVFALSKAWVAIVSAVETIYIRWLLLQGAVASSTIVQGLSLIGGGFLTMGTNALVGAGMVRQGLATILGSVGAVSIAMVGLAWMAISAWSDWRSAIQDVREEMERLKPPDFNAASVRDLTDYVSALHRMRGEAHGATEDLEGFAAANRAVIELLPWVESKTLKAISAQRGWDDATQEAEAGLRSLRDTYLEVFEAMHGPLPKGRTLGAGDRWWDEIAWWVDHLDLDPARQSAQEIADAVATGQAELIKLALQLGFSREQASGLFGEAAEEVIELGDEMTKLEEQIRSTFDTFGDVTKAFGDRKLRREVTDEIAAMRRELRETAKTLEGDELAKHWERGEKAIQDYRDKHRLTGKDIESWYAEQTRLATEFGDNLHQAMEQGYDPQLIARLLQQGPEEAGPMLEAMVSDHSTRLVGIVNEGEKAMREITEFAVIQARIMNQAIQADTDEKARAVSVALEIATANHRTGGRLTAEALADELEKGVDEVRRVAAMYGIELTGALNPILTSVGKPSIQAMQKVRDDWVNDLTSWNRKNTGGWITGPDIDRDVVPALLTPGEFVIRKESAKRIGHQALDMMNQQGRLPEGWAGYNAGGPVMPRPPKVGDWPLAQGAEGAMEMAWRAAQEFADRYAFRELSGSSSGLDPEFLRRFNLYAADVGGLRIVSGWRSYAQQDRLYKKWLAGEGNLAAPPGRSKHERGLAIDHSPHSTAAMRTAARSWRLHYPVAGEPWHVEPFAGGGMVFHHRPFDQGGTLAEGWNAVLNATGAPEPVAPIYAPHSPSSGVTTVEMGDLIVKAKVFVGDREISDIARVEAEVVVADDRRQQVRVNRTVGKGVR